MTNVTFSVDDDLYKRMKSRPEIKWSEVCRQAIIRYLEETKYPSKWSTEKLRSRLSSATNQLIQNLPLEKTSELAEKSRQLDKKRVKQAQLSEDHA
jgi:hypothetical protein